MKCYKFALLIGARGRNRTGTRVTPRGILSPLRLPVPPPGQIAKRLGSESNRRPRLCRPLHNHSATQPNTVLLKKLLFLRASNSGAGNETRTRDPNLGKVVLYQLSYSRINSSLFYQHDAEILKPSFYLRTLNCQEKMMIFFNYFYLNGIVCIRNNHPCPKRGRSPSLAKTF